ncbi:MAG: peptide-methionine (S)-S-oxide reductase, partial [Pseudomonadota bacterium]
ALKGVTEVDQGWIASTPPAETFSEAVIVHYAPSQIPLRVLIEVHLRTHASTRDHSLRSKYRSAVYCFDQAGLARAREILAELAPQFDPPPVTVALPFKAFKSSPPHYQDYYKTAPERPFCKTYIDPKLAKLRREFGEYAKA